MKIINKTKQALVLLALAYSTSCFSQSDSTNLPGLSTQMLMTPVTSSGMGIPDPTALDATTNYTEDEVETCPNGYYPNGAVPSDGSISNADNINGGVIYERTVTTNRYGTTTYGSWNEVNFLCTQIPPAPTCPTGENLVTAPYWDSTTNQWVGIVCSSPVATVPAQESACEANMGNDFYQIGFTNKYNRPTIQGPYSGIGNSQFSNPSFPYNDPNLATEGMGLWGGKNSFMSSTYAKAPTDTYLFSANGYDVCILAQGTTTIVGWYNILVVNINGGNGG
jgi:hypothetical protein